MPLKIIKYLTHIAFIFQLSYGSTVKDFSEKTRLVLGGIGPEAVFENGPYGPSISAISEVHPTTDLRVNIHPATKPDIVGNAWTYPELLLQHPSLKALQFESILWNHVSTGFVGGLFKEEEWLPSQESLGASASPLPSFNFRHIPKLKDRVISALKPMIEQLKSDGTFVYKSGEDDFFSKPSAQLPSKATPESIACLAENSGMHFLAQWSLFDGIEATRTSRTFFSTADRSVTDNYLLELLPEKELTEHCDHYSLDRPEITKGDTFGILQGTREALEDCGLVDVGFDLVVRSFSPHVDPLHELFYYCKTVSEIEPDYNSILDTEERDDSSASDDKFAGHQMVHFQISGTKK